MTVREALDQLLGQYVAIYRPSTELDPEWPPRCEIDQPDEEDQVRWRPTPHTGSTSFAELEEMTGVPLHPDAAEYFGSWWAGEIEARFRGEVVLPRTVWNDDELAEVVADLRDHLNAQMTEDLPRTIPVALTDSDRYYALDNESGQVVREEPDGASEVVAPSLAEFLNHLKV